MLRKRKHFPGIFIPVLILLFLAMLFGCGGDGPIDDTTKPATGGTGTVTGSITLSLAKLSDNSPTTSVTVDSPAKLTVTAQDSSGRPLVLRIISFSATSDLIFDPASVTVLTNANGTASIIVRAGKTTGATTIKAETTDNSGTAVSGTINLTVTGTGTVKESITLSLTKLSDNSATTSVSVDSPARLTATAKDSSGRPISSQVISFSTTSDLSFDPALGTALTDANGIASIKVYAGNKTGATTIRALITDIDGFGTPVSGTISLSFTGTGTAPESIILSLTKLSDNSLTTSVSVDSPAKLTATAKDSSGRFIASKVMTFSTTSDLSFDPASGTALTDANGIASITVKAGNKTGATTIRAEITDSSGTVVSGTIGLSVTTPNLSLSALIIDPTALSAGGSAEVRITVIDSSGKPFTTPVTVSFTSDGVKIGKAAITPQVYTVNGVASATYRDINYGAKDTITATLSIGGATTLTKTETIMVKPAAAGAISFVSATPANIALKGTGGAGRSETSVVVFKVLDTNGNTIRKKVNFSLVANTTVGGLSLTTDSADSDPLTGLVQTIVKAGTASTPVRVSATITIDDGTTIATTSDMLVVSTGIPDQDSFSLSASILNIEGWSVDGATSDITVRLADHYNNPVPDGTAVYFRTSGGSIQPSCTTVKGACTVQFTSQNPKPSYTCAGGPCGAPTVPPSIIKGRAVVWAYALGEESFTDLNGNGQFDPVDTFTDLPEPFLDANENGVRDANEEFIDTSADRSYSPGDNIFNGILRNPSISGSTTIHVRNSLTIVLSDSIAVTKIDGSISPPARTIPSCTTAAPFTPGSVSFNVVVADVNGNVMPAGTTIIFSTTNGEIMTTPTTYVVHNTNTISPPTYPVTIQSDATQSGTSAPYTCTNTKPTGIFTVTVKTPKGISSYQYVTVND